MSLLYSSKHGLIDTDMGTTLWYKQLLKILTWYRYDNDITQVQHKYDTPNEMSKTKRLKEKRGKEIKCPQMFVHIKLS